MSRTATAIRFDTDLHERLAAEAEARMVSINWLVNRLVREGFDRLVPLDEFRLTGPKPAASHPKPPSPVVPEGDPKP